MIDESQIRAWWNSLDPEVKNRFRGVVRAGDVQVDPEALPEGAPSDLQIPGDNSVRVTARLAELNSILESTRIDIEMAAMTYFELDSEVEEYLHFNGHQIERLRDLVWSPLGEPIRVMKFLERRLHSLDGLLKKMEMAIDPNPTSHLEDEFEWATRTGKDELAGLLAEAIDLRQKYDQGT